MLRQAWRRLIKRHIVDAVPDEMAACLDCGETVCPREKYQTCQYRLRFAESYRQARVHGTNGGPGGRLGGG